MKESSTERAGLRRRLSKKRPMKLVIAIVQDEDADPVVRELIESGFSVTKIGSTGGFLRRGNATLVIAVESQQLARVVDILQTRCRKREVPISASVEDKAAAGGAVVAVVNVEEFVKF